MIKFWNYTREYKLLRKEIITKVDKTISKGVTFFGNELKIFEGNFLKKYKSKFGIAVGSGTDALLISLRAINIENGDEVITSANTAIPTISAIVNCGAKPRLVDVGEDYLMNTSKIEKLINKKTKAIIPVHLYGQSCDMDKINKIAKKYKIKIIEDCAQAQGAKYKNRYVGTIGDFGCFSFYPTKVLGAYGDGGFIVTKNFKDYLKIRRLRFYGIETSDKNNTFYNKYYANENGFNSRLDEIQSSILNVKLKYLDKFINRRVQLANLYIKYLKKTELKLPKINKFNDHVFHLFTVSHPKKREIVKILEKKNIGTRVIYPYPINVMKAYKNFKFKHKDYVNSNKFSKTIFCLPLYPELKNSEVKKICNTLVDILKKFS